MRFMKGWKTKIGGALVSVAVFAYQLPGDMVVGSIKGVPLTVSGVLGLIGGIMGALGIADKLDDIKDASKNAK